jgi:hypothetical protein
MAVPDRRALPDRLVVGDGCAHRGQPHALQGAERIGTLYRDSRTNQGR